MTKYLRLTRSVLLGWATLLAIAFGVGYPVLGWTAPLFGAAWVATAHLGFDCMTLAAAGFVTGRFNRPHPLLAASLFALTLSFWDFGGILALNVPWLMRLLWNSFHDSRFLDSLVTSVETHGLLFGCLMAGAMLSRAKERVVSIVD